jgi:hypothetical protein
MDFIVLASKTILNDFRELLFYSVDFIIIFVCVNLKFLDMRRFFLVSLVCAVFFIACKSGDEEKKIDAQQYNDKMIELQIGVDHAVVKLIAAIDTYEQEAMNEALNSAISVCNNAIDSVEKSDDLPDDGTYKKQMLQLLNVYKDIIENEFTTIIVIYSLPDEEYTEEQVQEVTDLFDEALRKYSLALADFSDFQEKFAKSQGLVLEKE